MQSYNCYKNNVILKEGHGLEEAFDLYKDITERTDGDIYIGVVGPVRTGKSTFIKKMMDLLVLPNIENEYKKERTIDELPQSGSGKTIMTTQPKFVPNEAVEIILSDNASFKIRLVDCVGYLVKGALGYLENNEPRMVRTPWFDYEIPFEEAAEIGTKKVITDHSTIGLVITTDGTITDIPRSGYLEAEERVIQELKEIGKPFVLLLNSTVPDAIDTMKLQNALEAKYEVPVISIDILNMQEVHIREILGKILFQFPISQIHINMPRWIQTLDEDHWLVAHIIDTMREFVEGIFRVQDHEKMKLAFKESDAIDTLETNNIDLGHGIVYMKLLPKEGLFYSILSQACGITIAGDYHLISLIQSFVFAKKEYDRIAQALKDAYATGYGVVQPQLNELTLEEPELLRQGNRFGVKLKASAPSLHLIRVDIQTEVSPIVGTEKQSEELVNYLMKEFENDPSKIWNTDIFGKSLNELVKEGLSNKLMRMPEDAQIKIQETLQRIINDGNGGLICIIL